MTIKKTLKNIVYSGIAIAGLTGIVGSQFPGCSGTSDNQTYQIETPQTETFNNRQAEPKYTLDKFKRVLGKEKLEGIAGNWKEFEKMWDSDDKNDVYSRNLLIEIYTGKPIEELSLPEKYKADYKSFSPDSIQEEKLKEFKKRVPWKIERKNGKYDEADKKVLYVLVKVDEGANKAAAEWFTKQLIDYVILPMVESNKK